MWVVLGLTYRPELACWCIEKRRGAALCGHWRIPSRTASSRALETVLRTMPKRNLFLCQAVSMSPQLHVVASFTSFTATHKVRCIVTFKLG